MARFVVLNAEALRAAVLYEGQAETERDIMNQVPATLLPATGVYVLRKAEIGPRYLAPPPGALEERVIFLGQAETSAQTPPAALASPETGTPVDPQE